MLNKLKRREAMKSDAVLILAVEHMTKSIEIYCWPVPGVVKVVRQTILDAEFKARHSAVNATPAKLFMTDKPKIDKRRQKRYSPPTILLRHCTGVVKENGETIIRLIGKPDNILLTSGDNNCLNGEGRRTVVQRTIKASEHTGNS